MLGKTPTSLQGTVLVGALLAAVLVVRAAIDEPIVGISFFYMVPIVLGAALFGPRGGLAVGAIAGALFLLPEVSSLDELLGRERLLAATGVRLLVFCSVGYLAGRLLELQAVMRGELEELRALREALTPARVPRRPGLAIAASYSPAREGVAGDFYLVAEGPRGSSVAVIGDVSGKGVEAARRAAFVRASLASFSAFEDDPARLLELANQSLVEKAGTSSTFVTAACVVHRPGRVAYALAGHPAPLLLDSRASLEDSGRGLPLGMDLDLDVHPSSISLQPAQGLLLFTDGLTEARRDRELFGAERVDAILAEMAGASPAQLVQRLRRAVSQFSGGRLADDLCLLAFRETGGGS